MKNTGGRGTKTQPLCLTGVLSSYTTIGMLGLPLMASAHLLDPAVEGVLGEVVGL